MPKSKTSSQAMLTVTQIKSESGCTLLQKLALKGLGLRRIGTTRQLHDTPAVRGLVRKVHHLVTVSE
jgi:large subunit ribosomal protein L30